MPVTNGTSISLQTYGHALSIVALCDARIKKVVFNYNGTQVKEGVTPYALNGNGISFYNNVTYLATPGNKTIRIRASTSVVVHDYVVIFTVT
jgi:hypothetical protein